MNKILFDATYEFLNSNDNFPKCEGLRMELEDGVIYLDIIYVDKVSRFTFELDEYNRVVIIEE